MLFKRDVFCLLFWGISAYAQVLRYLWGQQRASDPLELILQAL